MTNNEEQIVDVNKKPTPFLKKVNELEKKVDGFDTTSDWSWLIGLALVAGIFSDNTIWKKKDDTETRLAKLETKTEMLEKIILK